VIRLRQQEESVKTEDRVVKTITSQRGMTLIEIMVVIAIIGVLATSIGFAVVNWLKSSKVEAASVQLNTISQALDGYYAKSKPNEYPGDIQDLLEGDNPLLKEEALNDPWGTLVIYSPDGDDYELCSAGPDKKSGGGDDICKGQK
jgi:general secretion pathway protein G